MTLLDLKDFLNSLIFGGSVYPHMFEVFYYRDLVIIGVLSDKSENGEDILEYSVDLEKLGNGHFVICNIALNLFVAFQMEAEKYLKLLNWYINNEEFYDSVKSESGNVQLKLFSFDD